MTAKVFLRTLLFWVSVAILAALVACAVVLPAYDSLMCSGKADSNNLTNRADLHRASPEVQRPRRGINRAI